MNPLDLLALTPACAETEHLYRVAEKWRDVGKLTFEEIERAYSGAMELQVNSPDAKRCVYCGSLVILGCPTCGRMHPC